MANTETITDLSHGTYVYDSDRQGDSLITMRVVYATASGLTAADATAQNTLKPFRGKPRHFWIFADRGDGKILRRKLPCSKTVALNGTTLGSIDGVSTWALGGFVGEKVRKK